ncbi:hypothetical protein MKJ04_14465 [Pontibacter sp. E15-1]|uniref:type IV toxin-antitoxin system AbiEi family antitoxin domain-containing protein n=1 Tax=Pontibacter sp. E15-1 TaxID=2919918 RepID=UPI001F4F2CF9|nr:hypothetical protein [Pontibacter sp. E15-1]MCJ8166047.1 hypothetical protein [Pontibacter sp. E15-1]
MAGKSRFAVAENNIRSFFKQGVRKVFTKDQVAEILEERRAVWRLPLSTYADKFIDQLVKKEILKKVEISFEGYVSDKERFMVKDASILQIAASLVNKSYLSHYSAVWVNGLTTQVPKTIYITFEQAPKASVDRTLTQGGIDAAFSKPQRKASSRAIYGDYTFVMLNGMFTNRLGVYSAEHVPVTNIERTLIDITVRPGYAGGVFSVLEAYKSALGQGLSINKLVATLDRMKFIYPYHQSVGFYLERAGYKGKKLEELRSRSKEFDFYLTYEITEKEYSADWKLYYPKGM